VPSSRDEFRRRHTHLGVQRWFRAPNPPTLQSFWLVIVCCSSPSRRVTIDCVETGGLRATPSPGRAMTWANTNTIFTPEIGV